MEYLHSVECLPNIVLFANKQLMKQKTIYKEIPLVHFKIHFVLTFTCLPFIFKLKVFLILII